MAEPIDALAVSDALVVLGVAGVVVPLARRLGLSPVLAFLGAGVLLGPYGLGRFGAHLPWLAWVTITHRDTVAEIAELGVVFLLFVIGLELSLGRLLSMRRLVFGLGLAQVALSAAALAGIALLAWDAPKAMVVGAALALSSTAIVLEVLGGQGRLGSPTGRAGFAVLLFQDLAVVPVLFVVGALTTGGPVLPSLGLALVKAVLTVGAIVGVGYYGLRPLFRLVAGQDQRELFVAATLFVAIGTAVVAALAGLSMALGAFIAGLLLAETEYRRAIEAAIDPFKGLLLGAFFFAVGTGIDPLAVLARPGLVIGAVLAMVAAKALIAFVLARLFRLPWPVAVETALLLGPAGEFAFVVVAAARAAHLLTDAEAGLLAAAASISMALIPGLGALGRRLGRAGTSLPALSPEITARDSEEGRRPVLVVGQGRVGRLVTEMLERHDLPWVGVDHDTRTVARARREGRTVHWGDATQGPFLESCGLAEAAGLIVTIDREVEAVVAAARAIRPDLVVVARARDAAQARKLYAAGVTDAVPETVEASLQLSEAVLVGLGIATGPVIASIHERRDEFRREFQGAAGRPVRAVQARRTG